jgi:N-acetylglucosaminyldiphosphoundecaprenol N-acetyl-beta-D-mannosaminyltransferase
MPIDVRVAENDGDVQFLDVAFSNLPFSGIVAHLDKAAAETPFSYVTTPNVDHVVRMSRDDNVASAFRHAVDDAALRLCDSRILAALAARANLKLHVVPGSDLTAALFGQVIRPGEVIAIVGGDDVLCAALQRRFPLIHIDHHQPPMGVLRNSEAQSAIADFVAATTARFIFLAIGAPQAEIVAQRIAHDGRSTGIGLCVGASIEFLTGQQVRAPRWVQRMSLEWLFRLSTNPRRLARRYLIDGPRIFLIYRDWKKRLKNGASERSAVGSDR